MIIHSSVCKVLIGGKSFIVGPIGPIVTLSHKLNMALEDRQQKQFKHSYMEAMSNIEQ